MKESKFSEAQIAFILRQADEGTPVAEVCRKAGINDATFSNWRKRYGGLTSSEVKKMRQLEDENNRLKKIVADLTLDKAMLQDVLSKKLWSLLAVVDVLMRSARTGRYQSAVLAPVFGSIPRSITTSQSAVSRLL